MSGGQAGKPDVLAVRQESLTYGQICCRRLSFPFEGTVFVRRDGAKGCRPFEQKPSLSKWVVDRIDKSDISIRTEMTRTIRQIRCVWRFPSANPGSA